ncbi:hypothetical protein V6N13_142020 [Hibiscus sabdariffa]
MVLVSNPIRLVSDTPDHGVLQKMKEVKGIAIIRLDLEECCSFLYLEERRVDVECSRTCLASEDCQDTTVRTNQAFVVAIRGEKDETRATGAIQLDHEPSSHF